MPKDLAFIVTVKQGETNPLESFYIHARSKQEAKARAVRRFHVYRFQVIDVRPDTMAVAKAV